MKNLTTLFVCALYIFCFPIFGKTQANPNDRLALIALYNSTDGANWTNTWDLSQPVSTWYGVTLNASGRVTCLDLDGADDCNLGGAASGGNNLIGNIPIEIGNIIGLEILSLNNNQLSGSIPSELGNLISLTKLQMQNNQLSGSIPVEFGNLINLESLNLNNNLLSGGIPSELGNLLKLQDLRLYFNPLGGSIPSELSNLVNLRFLFLTFNQLSGNVPAELSKLTNLTHLYLNDNQLSGKILVEISNLTDLMYLHLNDNQLNGSIPPEFSKLNNLIRLSLDYNQLSGSIPSGIGNFTNLTELFLNDNQLSGCYDPNLTNLCGQLSNYEISKGNNFDATWDDFCNIGTGACPCSETDYLSLVALYNATNGVNWTNTWNLSQPMSTWYGVTLNAEGCVISLNLGSNQLNGTIPTELGNLTNLQSLSLGANELNGNIPTELGNLINLQSLNLNFNELSGNIPSELGNLTKLTSLSIFSNQLSGNIPPELGNLTNLTWLSLNTNELSGIIPPELSSLTKLKYFGLLDNQLTGSIPSELGSLAALESLVLAFNRLSGNLPPELANLTNSTFWNLGGNQFSGGIPTYLGDLTGLTYLGLFNNPLGGTIPPELGNLTNLTYLGLWNTQVSGSIPPELGKLTNLTQLSLPNNQLTGTIPAELGNLTDLTQLRLNDNQLEGCYRPNLMNLCGQLSFGDSLITIGNNFDALWSDFCNTGAGTCGLCIEGDSLALVALHEATNGANWTNTWDLMQPMSTWYGVTVNTEGCVTCLDLNGNSCIFGDGLDGGNNLVGNLPTELGSLTNLTYLDLGYNQLKGSIPSELGSLANLTGLDLSNNQLSGNIPTELGNLTDLSGLYLNNNQLNGSIPMEFGNLSILMELALNSNQLQGSIPIELNNLFSIISLDDNQLSGTIPDFSSLTGLSLERNNFSHQDIATNYTSNSLIPNLLFSPQYYGYEQNPANKVGQQVILKPDPPIPYPNPSVLWLKEDSLLTNDFILNQDTFVIPSLDSIDIAAFEYRFIDSTLTPLVEFQSLPINNYIDGLDQKGEPIIEGELIIDLTDVPEDLVEEIQALLDSLGEKIDECGCENPLYLYSFDTIDIYSILDTLGRVESSKESTGVDGGFNRKYDTDDRDSRPIGESQYLPLFLKNTDYKDNVVVACLDTGIDTTHARIQSRLWESPEINDCTGRYGYNFVDNSGDVSDIYGHGTSVGGLIAENIPQEADIQLMPIKIYGDTIGTLFDLACGVHYAIDNGADLMNISVGYKGQKSIILESALQRAKNKNIIAVTSAGNDSTNIDKNDYWPAGFANTNKFDLSNVLTVAALDSAGNFLKASNYGPKTINFAVRGQNLVAPTLQDYGYLTGTSASAPLTTLTLAIQMANNKNRGYKSIINELNESLKYNAALDTLVKDGKWLDIQLDSAFIFDIKVLLEGACYTNGTMDTVMRADLYRRSVLPMSGDGTQIKHPFDAELEGFSNNKWRNTPRYSPDMVDWVLVSLRRHWWDTGTTFYKTPAWLLRDGTVRFYSPITKSDIDFKNLTDFYVIIEHHNHLPVITPMPLNVKKGKMEFNFMKENALNTPTGVGQKQIMPSVWAMYAGNMDNNYLGNECEDFGFEEITGADKGRWVGRNGFFGKYETPDANLDGDVNGADKLLWQPNNGIFSATPR